MAKLLEEWKEDLVEALTEHDLLLGSKHQKIEHAVLLVRNIAVGTALVLFIASLLHAPMEALVIFKDFLVSTDVCSNCIRLLSRFFCKFV